MAMWNQFPYTNFHEQYDDWLLRTVKKLEEDVSDITGERLTETVKKVIGELGFSVLYEASTETISFVLGGDKNG